MKQKYEGKDLRGLVELGSRHEAHVRNLDHRVEHNGALDQHEPVDDHVDHNGRDDHHADLDGRHDDGGDHDDPPDDGAPDNDRRRRDD